MYNKTPKDHTSHLKSYPSDVNNSGAINRADPVILWHFSPFYKKVLIPKSPTLTNGI